jgi:hypothetical protein
MYMYVDMEDPDIVINLRAPKSKYDAFRDEVEKFLLDDVGLAIQERRHSQVTHFAKDVSVRYFFIASQ